MEICRYVISAMYFKNKLSNMSLLTVVFVLVIVFLVVYDANHQCEYLNDLSTRKFYKIKTCHRSTLPLVSRVNVRSLSECKEFAKERGGLAINFSPPEASVSKYYQDYYFVNCQILGCPEVANSTTLVNDTTFDYYSLFSDLDALEDALCIKSIGLFRVFQEKLNYTNSIIQCHEAGGDLAHIASEPRTNGISSLIKDNLGDWFKIAYVGLDDMRKKRHFVNPMGEPLSCFKFRAWGPGQPRNKLKIDGCVTVDSESVWRVVNCSLPLSSVCELYPMAPPIGTNVQNSTCSAIKDKDRRRECRKRKKQRKHAHRGNNSTLATDRCKEDL